MECVFAVVASGLIFCYNFKCSTAECCLVLITKTESDFSDTETTSALQDALAW